MAAKPRLAAEVFDLAMDVAHRYPQDGEVKELLSLAADLHYGIEIGLSHINRGASGENARRLTREYQRFREQHGVPQ